MPERPEQPSVEEVRWEYQKQWNAQMERDLRDIQRSLDGLRGKIMWAAGFAAAVGALAGNIIKDFS